MGIFQSKSSKELDLAINYLNENLIQHYADWARILKLNIGASAAAQQPLEGVLRAVRLMWMECYARSVYIGIDSRHQFDLVKIKTPAITSLISDSQFAEAEFQQSTRMIQLMQKLVEDISRIKPEYAEKLDSFKREPELGRIQKESRNILTVALENGTFDTRNEMFVIKGAKAKN